MFGCTAGLYSKSIAIITSIMYTIFMKGKELIKLLEANGWQRVRITASHHIYKKAGESNNINDD